MSQDTVVPDSVENAEPTAPSSPSSDSNDTHVSDCVRFNYYDTVILLLYSWYQLDYGILFGMLQVDFGTITGVSLYTSLYTPLVMQS